MPNWVTICPNCKRQYTYAEVKPALLEAARRDPISTMTRPAIAPVGEKQRCPACHKEITIKSCDLTYSYL
jgi:hypothetical protein